MSDTVKRSYDSSRRKSQARLTRARIREAATDLFVERGYGATSIAAIAARAGVAPQTVYGAFGSKPALLTEAIGVAMAGDDEEVPLYGRPEFQAALTAADPTGSAAAFARSCRGLFERAAGIFAVAQAAAAGDAEIAELWAQGQRARLRDMRRLARDLGSAGHLHPDLTPEEAADLLFVVAGPESFRTLTEARGWTPARYERWLRATVRRTVLAP